MEWQHIKCFDSVQTYNPSHEGNILILQKQIMESHMQGLRAGEQGWGREMGGNEGCKERKVSLT